MKISIIIPAFLFLLIASCSMNNKIAKMNTDGSCELTKDRNGSPMLWGKCAPASFQNKPFSEWYQSQFSGYTVDSSLCSSLNLNNVKVDIFMGTWCGDSKREVPRMFKILGYCGVPEANIRLFTVNNSDSAYKQTRNGESANANVFRVPTFILYNEQGHEAGRIIESPVQTLEKDIAAILNAKSYVPHYEKMNRLVAFCRSAGEQEFSTGIQAEIEKVRDTNFASYTLNNLVYVLMAGGNAKRAGEIVQINERFFPDNVAAMTGKARYLRYAGKASEAAEYCRKILQKEPQNAMAKEILTSLRM